MSYKIIIRDIETGEKIKLTPEEYAQYKAKHSIEDKLSEIFEKGKPPTIHSGRGLDFNKKVDDNFKDVLKNISKRNPNNNMYTG